MYSCVISGLVTGLDVSIVKVEVDVGYGIPGFELGGVLATEVKEAGSRVRIAIKNSGISMRPAHITVNISPASVKKQGTGFDVPIAVGVLSAIEMTSKDWLSKTLIAGELSLNGQIHAVRGILPMLCKAKENGIVKCIIPKSNLTEAMCVEGMSIYPVEHLKDVIDVLNGNGVCYQGKVTYKNGRDCGKDYGDLNGQDAAKQATMVAVAGMHNLLYVGSPGCGKSMLASRIPSIMPPMEFEEQLEVSKIYSIAGILDENCGFKTTRPFRSPHHTVTPAALLGGGSVPGPGEITLAHRGVLFLDELTQYNMVTLEHLREPLEERKITIARAYGTYTFPADFMLVAAINPCKCGYYPDRTRCKCTESDIARYMGRISRPLWDRFDMVVKTEEVRSQDIFEPDDEDYAMDSAQMRTLIDRAILIQQERFADSDISFNGMMSVEDVKKYCHLGFEERALAKEAYEKLRLTARGYYKILKTARTIADIHGSEYIGCSHLSQAISYRSDKNWGME